MYEPIILRERSMTETMILKKNWMECEIKLKNHIKLEILKFVGQYLFFVVLLYSHNFKPNYESQSFSF